MSVSRRFDALVCAILAWLVMPTVLLADEVRLNDGSRLVGKIEELCDGKLSISTDFAGVMKIDVAKVASIVSDSKVNVALKSGDRLVGTITSTSDGSASTVNSAVGAAAVTTEQIVAIWPEGKPSPEDRAAQKAVEALMPKWTATVEGGIIATEGNTDTMNGNLRAELLRKTTEEVLRFYASADYAEQDDERTKHQVIVGSRYENRLGNPWENWGKDYFWYIGSEFEYDEFENLDLRATVAGGLGHYWIQEERMDLTTRLGLGYRHQSFRDGRTTDDPILDAGLDFRWDIREWLRFTHAMVYNPSIEEFSDYRLTLDDAFSLPLAKSDKWRFKTGVRNEYNSRPAPGFDNLDSTYYANILVELK